MSKKAIARITAVLILTIIILAAAVVTVVIYYVTLPPSGPATIAGRITDKTTGAPIVGATVKLDGLTYTTGSDRNYSFSVNVGNYTLTASMTGYVTNTTSVSAPAETKYAVERNGRLGDR